MKKIILLLLLLPIMAVAQTDNTCFCVALARTYNPGVPRLNADMWYLLPPQTRSVPLVGGQILLKYETQWDVATIMSFTKTGMELAGVDFETCGETKRIIEFNDPRIFAFFDF